jgi:hypothetical protein
MAYTPTVWKNGEFPPIDAEHLNKIEQGIADAISVTPQNLSNKEKAQARGNISALNGQFLVAESAGGQIGWYRITEPFVQYNTSGYLTVSHAWANGGASELLLGVSSAPDTHGKLQCLRSVGQINSVPYISNARLVKVDGSTLALDLYVSGTGKNDWNLQLCNCGHNPITLTTPTFISTDDTLPSGETLAAVMEYQNPPMLLGVEYKTMERYLGKPVYCRLIDCGKFPPPGNSRQVAHGISNCYPVSITARMSNGNTVPFVEKYTIGADGVNVFLQSASGVSDQSANATVALMRYTKTTD